MTTQQFNLLFDVPFPVRMQDGTTAFLCLPEALAHAHATAILFGHPYLDMLAKDFLACITQTFMVPADEEEWEDFLVNPPSSTLIREKLDRFAACFDLVHPDRPFMQVAFETEGMPVPTKKPKRKPIIIEPGDGEVDEEDAEPMDVSPLSSLLPEEPSKTQMKSRVGGVHFTRAGRMDTFCPAATGLLLYGMNMVGVGGGGGYYTAPTSSAVHLRVGISGIDGMAHVLWRDTWVNVLDCSHAAVENGSTDPMTPENLLGWMEPALRRSIGKDKDGDAIQFASVQKGRVHGGNGETHPFAMMWGMSRRARLEPPEQGACSLTGVQGMVFRSVLKSPGGPRSFLSRRSFHPLFGKSTEVGGKRDGTTRVTQVPGDAAIGQPEWSCLLPMIRDGSSAQDRMDKGVAPCVAALSSPGRRAALMRLFRQAGMGRRNPSLPIHATFLRQEHVLEGWSESSMRLWLGPDDSVSAISRVLHQVQSIRTWGDKVAKNVADEVAKAQSVMGNTTLRKDGETRKVLARDVGGRFSRALDSIGEEMLATISSMHENGYEQEAISTFMASSFLGMEEAIVGAVDGADYGMHGGVLGKAIALRVAQDGIAAFSKSKTRAGKEEAA